MRGPLSPAPRAGEGPRDSRRAALRGSGFGKAERWEAFSHPGASRQASARPRRSPRERGDSGLGPGLQALCGSRGCQWPTSEPPLPQLWPHNWQPGGPQTGGETTEEGARAREIPERAARPGIHTIDMQIKCKSGNFFFLLKNLQIWPFWKESTSDQLGVSGFCWPPLPLHPPVFAAGELSVGPSKNLDSSGTFLLRTFPP